MADSFPPVPGNSDDSFPQGQEVPAHQTSPDSATLLFRRYRVIRELGRGGMGVVVLAHDHALDIPVAVKLVPDLVVKDTEAVADLRKEVLRGMALNHDGVVRTHHFEKDETGAGIVMEFIEGDTLTDLKQRQSHGCFDPEQIFPWLEQLCAVLDYAHREKRVIHRDLKPRNIMLSRQGRVKVADFGIAAVISDSMSRHSMEGKVSGTLSYMSPQQAEGRRPSHLDDIHALGATIYELLTGKPPFFRGNPASVFQQILAVVPPGLAERREELDVVGRTDIPLEWEESIAACLAKDPANRPQSAGELLSRLRPRLRVPRPQDQSVSSSKDALPSARVGQAPLLPVVAAEPKVGGELTASVPRKSFKKPLPPAVPPSQPVRRAPVERRLDWIPWIWLSIPAVILAILISVLADGNASKGPRQPSLSTKAGETTPPPPVKSAEPAPFVPSTKPIVFASTPPPSTPSPTPPPKPAAPTTSTEYVAEIERMARFPGAKSDPALIETANGLADLLKIPPIGKGVFDYAKDSDSVSQCWTLSAADASAVRHASDVLGGLSPAKESSMGAARARLWVAAVLADLLKPRSTSIYASGTNTAEDKGVVTVDIEYKMEDGHLNIDREGIRIDYLGTQTFKLRPGQKSYPDGTRTKVGKGRYRINWSTSRLAQLFLEDAIDPETHFNAPEWMAKRIGASSVEVMRELPIQEAQTTVISGEPPKMDISGRRDGMIESINSISFGGLLVDVEVGRIRGFGGGLLFGQICVRLSDR